MQWWAYPQQLCFCCQSDLQVNRGNSIKHAEEGAAWAQMRPESTCNVTSEIHTLEGWRGHPEHVVACNSSPMQRVLQ